LGYPFWRFSFKNQRSNPIGTKPRTSSVIVIAVVKFVLAPEVFPASTSAPSRIGSDTRRIATAITTPMIVPELVNEFFLYHRRLAISKDAKIASTPTGRKYANAVIAWSRGAEIPTALS